MTDGPIRDAVLYHYLLGNSEPHTTLRPLSDFPDSERWKALDRAMPGHYESLYRAWAEPVLLRPYPNSGVYLTPIDFRQVPGSKLIDCPRLAIPVDSVDPAWAVLTYEWEGKRVCQRLSSDALVETARLWHVEDIRRWFARDRQRMFFYVPQVVSYQPGGLPVRPA